MSEINQTINNPYEEYDSEADRVAVDFNDEGFVKNITIEEGPEGMGDVQAGIEFIYHMREHLLDIGVATLYGLVVYALVLWVTKKIKG
tara:strand:+ start:30 stop:293 length:264 start_codon:yes stop_codon:yes gene_type:complete